MKKYIKPDIESIDFQTVEVLAMSVYDETTDSQLIVKKRDSVWDEYENN